jgi:DNA-directed RNA polymerase subunit RPC12/RpoP
MPTIKNKRLKPIDQDIHLKYRCIKCSVDHWLSMKETQTKGFRIVCDCGEVFRVKLIEKIDIIYQQTIKKEISLPVVVEKPLPPEKIIETIPLDLLKQCCTILLGYGFDISEAETLVVSTFNEKHIYTCVDLIKQALKNFGEKNG